MTDEDKLIWISFGGPEWAKIKYYLRGLALNERKLKITEASFSTWMLKNGFHWRPHPDGDPNRLPGCYVSQSLLVETLLKAPPVDGNEDDRTDWPG